MTGQVQGPEEKRSLAEDWSRWQAFVQIGQWEFGVSRLVLGEQGASWVLSKLCGEGKAFAVGAFIDLLFPRSTDSGKVQHCHFLLASTIVSQIIVTYTDCFVCSFLFSYGVVRRKNAALCFWKTYVWVSALPTSVVQGETVHLQVKLWNCDVSVHLSVYSCLTFPRWLPESGLSSWTPCWRNVSSISSPFLSPSLLSHTHPTRALH